MRTIFHNILHRYREMELEECGYTIAYEARCAVRVKNIKDELTKSSNEIFKNYSKFLDFDEGWYEKQKRKPFTLPEIT